MSDIYLDPNTHDYVFENGDLKWVETEQDLCRQAVVVALKAFRGTWFRDITFGAPWLENDNNPISILGSKDKFLVDAEIRKVILNESTVQKITKYESSLDKITGRYQINVDVLSNFGPITITAEL